MTTDVLKQPAGNVTMRQGLGGQEAQFQGDLAAISAAAAAKAEIEARFSMAMMQPRSYKSARDRIMEDAKRPTTAAIALYHKPQGKKKNAETGRWEQQFIDGLSVRFLESAIRNWGNMHVVSRITHDDAEKQIIAVGVLDLEANNGYVQDAVIQKTVERSSPDGRVVRGERENVYGKAVYIVVATEDELRQKVGAERSKLIRDIGQRLIPRELLEEARELIDETVASDMVQNPEAAKKKIFDGFAKLGVTQEALMEYVGRRLEDLPSTEIADLRALYNGLKDHEFTWAEAVKLKNADPEAAEEGQPEAPAGKKLKDKLGVSKAAEDAPQT